MWRGWILLFGGAVATLSGCAAWPTGPSVMVLPTAGKPFEQFQAEDALCRQWAAQQIGGVSGAPATQQTAVGAAVGTVVGAGLGAAIGSASGNAGAGAAIGAGTGLLMGTAAGANADQLTGGEAQRRYDMAYQQCMYAKGNQVPAVVRTSPRRAIALPPPPPPGYSWAPQPPPISTGFPPPVPPDYVPSGPPSDPTSMPPAP
ncbi:MAG: glycine zipper family protein [candidate division NC10 bacterium]|nr:glycine zipper family protein [candidate division NC10 bacterium]